MNLDAARTRSYPRGDYEEYHPYGSTAWWAGPSGLVSQKRYRFTGMERDDETGLQCHGVRYYAVWLGRWVSADPIGLGDGVNRFGYCGGSPACLTDPAGLQAGTSEDPIRIGTVEFGSVLDELSLQSGESVSALQEQLLSAQSADGTARVQMDGDVIALPNSVTAELAAELAQAADYAAARGVSVSYYVFEG